MALVWRWADKQGLRRLDTAASTTVPSKTGGQPPAARYVGG
jgi:hypothetical protein